MNANTQLALVMCAALIAGCAREQPATSSVVPAAATVANVPGPYDGTWMVDAASAGSGTSTSDVAACEAVRLQFDVKNNQVNGMLGRSPYGGGRVTQSGPGTTPVSGTVQPDGTLFAQWQSYQATGKLTGDKAEMHWRGTCGPRVATGGRVTSTEGAGSTR
ncbi:MAG TPA: hypothetical protein VJO12_11385 [Stellaceae bacterium]|nr:hypothetical protein [Stellaceae bacterium]